ncbi:TauD/TfdA dioxygenase family protein, partial [Streptomyces sp. MCAF7]
MKITPQVDQKMGATVTEFDVETLSTSDALRLKDAIYQEKLLILKDQHLSPQQFIALGKALGTIEVYYEPMYHHPDHEEIFVSSSTPESTQQ